MLVTYTLSSASSDVVREAGNEARRAHLDNRLDHVEGRSRDGRSGGGDAGAGVGATANGVVHDLTALVVFQLTALVLWRLRREAVTYLGVANEHDLGARAPLVESVDGRRNGGGALPCGVAVGDTATGGLTTAGRVDNSLGRGARVRAQDEVDDGAGRAVSGGGRGFTGPEDVDRGALALGQDGSLHGLAVDGRAADEQRVRRHEEESDLGSGPHVDGYELALGRDGKVPWWRWAGRDVLS